MGKPLKPIIERCGHCGKITHLLNGDGVCPDCFSMNESIEEVEHDLLIRCPNCVEHFHADDHCDYSIFEEGEHNIYCPACEYKFKITTKVEYSFVSPELHEP